VFAYAIKGAGIQFNTSTTGATIDHCKILSCDGAGIDRESCGANDWVTYNYCASNNYVIFIDTVSQCHAIGNQCISNAYGLACAQVTNSQIQNNTCASNTIHGIVTYATSYGLNVENNQSFSNGQVGISIIDTTDSNFIGNRVIGNSASANNTYDNIQMFGASNYNNLQNNLCRVGVAANKPAHGIWISSVGTPTGNICTNNHLHNSGVTANFTDNGTGTQTTAGNYTT
jgi:hypothetical protein